MDIMADHLEDNKQSVIIHLINAIDSNDFPHIYLEAIKKVLPYEEAKILSGCDQPYDCIRSIIANQQAINKSSNSESSELRYVKDQQSTLMVFPEKKPRDIFQLIDVQQTTTIVHLSSHSENFCEQDISQFSELEPLLSCLLKKWSYKKQHNLNRFINQAFDNFGKSVLSKREKETVNHLLSGESSKSTAKKMGITTETERGYRKAIYNKLSINSHTELYHLFFKSLSCVEQAGSEDPLKLLKWITATDAGLTLYSADGIYPAPHAFHHCYTWPSQ